MAAVSVLKKCHVVDADDGRYLTPKGRMTFVAFDKKWRSEEDKKKGDEGQYAGTMIIPPDADMKLLIDAANELARGKFNMKGLDFAKKGTYKGIKSPFLDASEKASAEELGLDSLEGYIMIRANSYNAPIPVRLANNDLVPLDEYTVECYAGRYARFEVKLHSYDRSDGKGVKFYLQGAQMLSSGDKLKSGGGGGGTADNFEAVEDDEDDALA